jgi:Flp pilus assembly protein TadG
MMRKRANACFMARLRRDTSGNVIAIAAAALIPLAGLIGGGVDMSRMYLTKTRLQQACDAGALAGRKAMAAGSWTTGANSTAERAMEFFEANFEDRSFGTGPVTKTFTEVEGEVIGSARVAVPMTMMRIFNMQERIMEVTCTAKMEIPNTDVMFVLDTTYSMQGSKMTGLKSAVKCFYEALLRVNTPEVCTASDPTATSYTGTAQIRLGFVPYGVNVNVGRLLHNDWIADQWTYQTRTYGWDGASYETSTTEGGWVFARSGTKTSQDLTRQSSCPSNTITQTLSAPVVTSSTASNGTITTTSTVTRTTNGNEITNCRGSNSNRSYTRTTYSNYKETKATTTTKTQIMYTYEPRSLDVSGLKSGNYSWRSSIMVNVGTNGANTSVTWNGCIEERKTFQNTNRDPSSDWNPIPADALDMDIDLVPNAATPGSQWGPMLENAVWARYSGNTNNRSFSPIKTNSTIQRNFRTGNCHSNNYARKLKEYRTSNEVTDFNSYVNNLVANDYGTYHDSGMLWGARLISPTGIFASENQESSSGGNIQRHLIFMTDGNAQAFTDNYGLYGIPFYDRRQTSYDPSTSELEALTNARLLALCSEIKRRNITLWVISYGGGVDSDNESRLTQCASPSSFFSAADATALRARFQQIAAEIADLRLTN